MKRTLVVLAVLTDYPKWFRRKTRLRKMMFAVRVSGLFFDLGLNVGRLSALARAHFFIESNAVYAAASGRFDPKRMAMRYFGWYCAENPKFDFRALQGDGARVEAIFVMRSWASAEPCLSKAAEKEIQLIVKHLYMEFETLKIDKAERLHAQLQLLELAAKQHE